MKIYCGDSGRMGRVIGEDLLWRQGRDRWVETVGRVIGEDLLWKQWKSGESYR